MFSFIIMYTVKNKWLFNVFIQLHYLNDVILTALAHQIDLK